MRGKSRYHQAIILHRLETFSKKIEMEAKSLDTYAIIWLVEHNIVQLI